MTVVKMISTTRLVFSSTTPEFKAPMPMKMGMATNMTATTPMTKPSGLVWAVWPVAGGIDRSAPFSWRRNPATPPPMSMSATTIAVETCIAFDLRSAVNSWLTMRPSIRLPSFARTGPFWRGGAPPAAPPPRRP